MATHLKKLLDNKILLVEMTHDGSIAASYLIDNPKDLKQTLKERRRSKEPHRAIFAYSIVDYVFHED